MCNYFRNRDNLFRYACNGLKCDYTLRIYTLIGKIKLTKSEKVIDNVLGFFTDAPFGTPDLINSFKNLDKEFYLVTEGDKQYFVTVTDEFIESRRLVKHIVADKFEIGNWKFVKCKYEVKRNDT